jgi:Fic family protein
MKAGSPRSEWELPDWPAFTWDEKALSKPLAQISREQGRLLGKMEALGFDLRSEAYKTGVRSQFSLI